MSGSGWCMKILSGAAALGPVLPFPTTADQLILFSKSSSPGVQGCSSSGQELKGSGDRALKLWSDIRVVRPKPEGLLNMVLPSPSRHGSC